MKNKLTILFVIEMNLRSSSVKTFFISKFVELFQPIKTIKINLNVTNQFELMI